MLRNRLAPAASKPEWHLFDWICDGKLQLQEHGLYGALSRNDTNLSQKPCFSKMDVKLILSNRTHSPHGPSQHRISQQRPLSTRTTARDRLHSVSLPQACLAERGPWRGRRQCGLNSRRPTVPRAKLSLAPIWKSSGRGDLKFSRLPC